MSFTNEHIYNGTDTGLTDILSRYQDGADISGAIYGDLSNLDIDTDVSTALQSYTSANTSFWDKLYIANEGEYVGSAVQDFSLGLTANALAAQQALSVTLKNEVKLLTSTTVSIEQAFVQYLDDMPVKVYVEKITGTIVRSETVLSETTHIPIGKMLAGAGHAITAYTIFETFKDTIVASYNAATGQGDM